MSDNRLMDVEQLGVTVPLVTSLGNTSNTSQVPLGIQKKKGGEG